MKQKIVLILIFLSYLIITFTPQMPGNMVIIGYKEFETIKYFFDIWKYENDFWLLGLMFIICGQITLIYAIFNNDKMKILKYSKIGLLFLVFALFVIGIRNTLDYGNVWIVTFTTSLLFLGLSVFYYFKYLKNKLPPDETTQKQSFRTW